MPNVKKNHSNKIATSNKNTDLPVSCAKKDTFLLKGGKCIKQSVIYKAKIETKKRLRFI